MLFEQAPRPCRSGRERFSVGLGLVEERHRLEAIVAGIAVPEISDTAGHRLGPFGYRDRSAALRARILLGQICQACFGHGALPYIFLLRPVLALTLKWTGWKWTGWKWDRMDMDRMEMGQDGNGTAW